MARRILAEFPPGCPHAGGVGRCSRPTSPTKLGVPMGARLAGAAAREPGNPDPLQRRELYNGRAAPVPRYTGPEGLIRLHQDDGELLLDLPAATEAVVPQRPHTRVRLIFGPNGPRTSHGDGHKCQVPGVQADLARPAAATTDGSAIDRRK